jgi:hypothetical protein
VVAVHAHGRVHTLLHSLLLNKHPLLYIVWHGVVGHYLGPPGPIAHGELLLLIVDLPVRQGSLVNHVPVLADLVAQQASSSNIAAANRCHLRRVYHPPQVRRTIRAVCQQCLRPS